MGQHGYWRRVAREAFARAKASGGFTAMNLAWSAVSIVAIVWGLFFLGSDDASRDESITRLIAITLGVTGFLAQAVFWSARIPPEWDSAKQGKIDALEKKLAPRLLFEHKYNDTKHLQKQTIKSETKNDGISFTVIHDYAIGRVSVKNYSGGETVSGAEATLIHYREGDSGAPITVDRKLIAPSINQPIINIHPTRSENFNLFRCPQWKDADFIELGPFVDGSYVRLNRGKYVVKVTVSANSMPHIYQMYFVWFKDDGSVLFRPWQPGDTEHQFDLRDINQSGLVLPQLRPSTVAGTQP